MFIPSTGYHAHTYFDSECDTPGNDVVFPETSMGGKNLNTISHTANSNSQFFDFNRDLPNKPDHPSFYRGEKGAGEARKTAKKAFERCTRIPFDITPTQDISFTHNNIPMAIYTDAQCKNEHIIPVKENTNKGYTEANKNVDNRTVENTNFDVNYTTIKSYLTPAQKSNPMYYRTFLEYPDGDSSSVASPSVASPSVASPSVATPSVVPSVASPSVAPSVVPQETPAQKAARDSLDAQNMEMNRINNEQRALMERLRRQASIRRFF
jgi:hypothetical protein